MVEWFILAGGAPARIVVRIIDVGDESSTTPTSCPRSADAEQQRVNPGLNHNYTGACKQRLRCRLVRDVWGAVQVVGVDVYGLDADATDLECE